MKNKFLLTYLLVVTYNIGFAQSRQVVDTLNHELAIAKDDTARVWALINLGSEYRLFDLDSSALYEQQAYTLAHSIHYPTGEIWALGFESSANNNHGNYSKGLGLALKALKIARENHLENQAGVVLENIGLAYALLMDYHKALYYLHGMRELGEKNGNRTGLGYAELDIGQTFMDMNQPDSAIF